MTPLFFHLLFTGVDLKKIKDCVGDPNANVENPVLKAEQEAQVGFLKCKLQTFFMIFLFNYAIMFSCLFCIWFQIGKGSRGDVTILPTLVINNRQYRGTRKLF